MHARLLGWAGVELRDGDASLVIDPLRDAAAVFASAGERAREIPVPALVEPDAGAAVGLVTHLHRDHADAAALADALAPGAPVLLPEPFGGGPVEEAAVAGADAELRAAGIPLRTMRPWEHVEVAGWSITALPAADGTGDPQVSWLVQRDGVSVVHAGDTLPHGWWWRVAQRAGGPVDAAFLPINAARLTFPHRRPASPRPAVMSGEDAAVAAAILRARVLVPIHYDAYDFPSVFDRDRDALATLRRAATTHALDVHVPALGAWFDLAAREPAAA